MKKKKTQICFTWTCRQLCPSGRHVEKTMVTTGCPLALLSLPCLAGDVLQEGMTPRPRCLCFAIQHRLWKGVAGGSALFSAIPLFGPGWILPDISLRIQIHKTISKWRCRKDAYCFN